MHPPRLALALLLLAPMTALDAQSAQPLSVQGSALFVATGGTAYEDLKRGIGVEGQLRYNFGNAWSLGGGIQYSSHDFAEEVGIDEALTLAGGFVEPRYVLPFGSDRLGPYASVRLAILRQSVSFSGAEGSATGVQVNGGGGVLFNLTPRVNLDAGLTLGFINFGDYEVRDTSTGEVFSGPTGSGTNLVFRVGLSIGLGSR